MNIKNLIKPTTDFFPSHPEINRGLTEELFKSGFYERENDFLVLLKKPINLWESFDFKVKEEVKDTKGKKIEPDYSIFIIAASHWFSEKYFNLIIDKAITQKPEKLTLAIKNDLILACLLNNKYQALEKLVAKEVLTQQNLLECLFVYKTNPLYKINQSLDFKNYKTIVNCWKNIEDKRWGYILNGFRSDIYQNIEIILTAWNTRS